MKKPINIRIEKATKSFENIQSRANVKPFPELKNLVSKDNNRLIKKAEKYVEKEPHHYISSSNTKTFALMGIQRIRHILNYKDLRSVTIWCRKNNVFIIQQGNRKFVNIREFTLSFYKPFIKHLKRINKNWKELFLNYLNGSIAEILEEPDVAVIIKRNYSPNNTKESSFLDKMKKL